MTRGRQKKRLGAPRPERPSAPANPVGHSAILMLTCVRSHVQTLRAPLCVCAAVRAPVCVCARLCLCVPLFALCVRLRLRARARVRARARGRARAS